RAGREEIGGEGVVVHKQGRKVRPERDSGGAGEGGEIDDQLRPSLAGAGQGVAEDEATFGVGIADLDAEALAAGKDVAGAEGVAGNGVLDRGDDEVEADGEAALH